MRRPNLKGWPVLSLTWRAQKPSFVMVIVAVAVLDLDRSTGAGVQVLAMPTLKSSPEICWAAWGAQPVTAMAVAAIAIRWCFTECSWTIVRSVLPQADCRAKSPWVPTELEGGCR